MLRRSKTPVLHDDPAELAGKYVVGDRDRVRGQASRFRNFYRLSGLLMLTISVTIPFLAGVHFGHQTFVIGVLGVVIAFMTAARNFFHWDRAWTIKRLTAVRLTRLLGLWETDLARIRAAGGDDAATRGKELERTRQLISEASTIVEHDFEEYFSQLSWPDPEEGRKGVEGAPPAK